ncbi:putative secreted protein [Streptomyces ambofaciens ATCC 23877]|uniref:Secreted protein n=2 Tax=Streptomyces ambofaciens TaxID=1889 RepID=A0ABM6B570_STRAM|nr:hypothetical protein [Streptomyces ambofaciens]AKZ58937.1 putative secreted protein [Streptomyces ambofaciens ATCC 23877]ANB09327.1 hypothetical protein SAM40697_5371 [Streptomyces ambofaciens]
MRPAGRTAPATVHPLAAALTALLAVLLTLVPAGSATGTGGAAAVAPPAHAVTTAPHPAADHHADDGCATPCSDRARARHDHLGERPAPPDRPATAPRSAGAAPAAGGRTPAGSGAVALSPGRTHHDRGRAPPAPSGT